MNTAFNPDASANVLRRMKNSGFDFARLHPVEFYAIFPDEACARSAAGRFCGESLFTQVSQDDGTWHLQVSKVMCVTHAGIGEFELAMEAKVKPLGGVLDGWGVTQEYAPLQAAKQQQ